MKPIRRLLRNAADRARIAVGLLIFLWRRKVWWMVPLVAVMLVLGTATVAYVAGFFWPMLSNTVWSLLITPIAAERASYGPLVFLVAIAAVLAALDEEFEA